MPWAGIAWQQEQRGFDITCDEHEICHVSLEEEPDLCEELSLPDTSSESQIDSEGRLYLLKQCLGSIP